MNPAEAAVAHHEDVVAALSVAQDALHESVEIVASVQFAAERGKGGGHVPFHAAAVAEYLVGLSQASGQGGFHAAELHGVGARFEHGDDARTAHFLPQPGYGGGDGGGVVGEVVIHGDATHAAFHFHAPLHVLELRKRFAGYLNTHAGMAGGGDHGQRVEAVVFAQQLPSDMADGLAVV